jgi:hypothetical protein
MANDPAKMISKRRQLALGTGSSTLATKAQKTPIFEAATPPARTARSAWSPAPSVRSTRAVALPKPSGRARSLWYFQRYAGCRRPARR